jgi:hypothetical protein
LLLFSAAASRTQADGSVCRHGAKNTHKAAKHWRKRNEPIAHPSC